MPSDVDIANLALVKLGEGRILSFAENVKAARSVNAIYALQRDNELRARIWSFAAKRVRLPALTDAPAFGYDFAYELPADFLKVIAVGDLSAGGTQTWIYQTSTDSPPYRVEGRTIVSSLGAPLSLRYTRRVTNPSEFDACFVDALACKLAMELAEELTSSNSKKESAAQAYQYSIRMAVRANAIEQPAEELSSSSWLLARLPG